MNRVRFLTQAAMIAAIYVVLTMLANAMGLASYAIQVRFSEALTILPFFTAAAVPGLAVGCLISNILAGGALLDIVFGTIATLIGALCTYLLRKKSKWLAPIPPIIANAIIVPPVIYAAYGISPIWLSVITVTIGEIISCGILGMLLLHGLLKYRRIFDLQA